MQSRYRSPFKLWTRTIQCAQTSNIPLVRTRKSNVSTRTSKKDPVSITLTSMSLEDQVQFFDKDISPFTFYLYPAEESSDESPSDPHAPLPPHVALENEDFENEGLDDRTTSNSEGIFTNLSNVTINSDVNVNGDDIPAQTSSVADTSFIFSGVESELFSQPYSISSSALQAISDRVAENGPETDIDSDLQLNFVSFNI